MKLRTPCVLVGFLLLSLSLVQLTVAQATPETGSSPLPRLVRFGGTVKDPNGNLLTGVVGITFALYSEQTGGAALWLETQNVTADGNGHYVALLGSTKPDGLPTELFTTEQARWVGVQVSGQAEQPRVLLLSVPYAVKAADAATLGGKPASAYLLNPQQTEAVPASAQSNPAAASKAASNADQSAVSASISGGGTKNYIPRWTSSTNLGNSIIFQSTSGYLGVGTPSPEATLDIREPTGMRAIASGNGIAVYGNATVASGTGKGVEGDSSSTSGTGVAGVANATTGFTQGMWGGSFSTGGVGVIGQAYATSGSTIGVEGISSSGAGTAGVFNNVAGGKILSAQNNSVEKFSVDGGGNVGLAGVINFSTGQTFPGSAQLNANNLFTGNQAMTAPFGSQNPTLTISGGPSGTTPLSVDGGFGTGTGITVNGTFGAGVQSDSEGFGLYGTGTAGGVYGALDVETITGAAGVYGQASAALPQATFGVEGFNPGPAGIAVVGTAVSSSKTGGLLVGSSPFGVWGDTGSAGTTVTGVLATADNATALWSENNSLSPTGYFYNQSSSTAVALSAGGSTGSCQVFANGNLTCTGSKSAVVPVANGRSVALNAVESPENWFEDFGSAQLSGGIATITLDPEFAQTVISSSAYHVFVTPRGECEGLYVTNTTPTSFEVRELHAGRSTIEFDYRVVAHRKGYENIRLADMTDELPVRKPSRARSTPMQLPVHFQLPAKRSVTNKATRTSKPEPK